MSNHKLELTRVAKENLHKLVSRIFPENTAKFYHAEHRVADNDLLDEVEA